MTTDSGRNRKDSASSEDTDDVDAIALLTADHHAVKAMFKQYASLKDRGSSKEKQALVQQICSALTVHAQIEEEIFYPAVREAIDDDDLMDEAEVEHEGAKALIAQLESARPSDDHYDAKVKVLGELVDHHVKEEEKQMFPEAKKVIDAAALGAALQARQAQLEHSASTKTASPAPRASAPMA